MGKKPIVSITYENDRISMKKKNNLPYIKCVLNFSCVVHGPIYGLFCKRFSLIYKVYQGWGLQRSGPTDPERENRLQYNP